MTDPGRIGLLGGTFDPIHRGHVAIAEAARRALDLDRVLLLPSHVPPHRESLPVASAFHRFAMVAFATDEREGLLASDLELRRPAPSYTTVTLQHLIEAGHAPTQLFFIAGADAFAEIATWRGYPTLLDQAHFVVVSRPGHALETHATALPPIEPRLRRIGLAGADRPPTTDVHVFLMQADTPDVASSTVRSRIAAGAPLDGLLPDAVARYIRAHRLYEPAPSGKVLA